MINDKDIAHKLQKFIRKISFEAERKEKKSKEKEKMGNKLCL